MLTLRLYMAQRLTALIMAPLTIECVSGLTQSPLGSDLYHWCSSALSTNG